MSDYSQYHQVPPTPPWDPTPPPPPRKRKAWPWVLSSLLLVTLLVIGGCAALLKGAADRIGEPNAVTHSSASPTDTPSDEPTPTDTDTPSDGPEQLQIGQGMDVSQDNADTTTATITVKDVRWLRGPKDSWSNGPENGWFVIFTVRVACHQGKLDFSADDFYVRTKDGDRYNTDDGNAWEATSKDTLGYSTVNAGEHRKGPVAFDSSRKHGELVLDPNLEGQPIAEWSF